MSERDARRSPQDEFIRRGLKLTHLRLLAALQETGQISGAAAKLAITQPAASRLMADLERIVGVDLHQRHARGVALTQAGEAIADKAQAILRGLDEAHELIGEVSQGISGRVRLGSVTGPALELVLPVLRELRVAYPEIEISVDVDTSDKLAEGLLSRELDFYIGRLPQGVDGRSVRMRRIGPEPLGLIARSGHALNARCGLKIADCLAYDWVMQPAGGLMRRTIETYLLEEGLALPQRILGTSSLLLTLAIISETNAIAPVALSVGQFYARRNALGGNIRVLDIRERLAVSAYSIVLPAQRDLSSAAARVLEGLEERIRLAEAQAAAPSVCSSPSPSRP